MGETGFVVEAANGNVTVRMRRTPACERCNACGIGARQDEMQIVARNECNAQENDRVVLELRPDALLKAAAILYGLPLAGLLTGFMAGAWIGTRWFGEWSALVGFGGGIALAGLAYFVIKRLEPVWRAKGYTPIATRLAE